MIKARWAILNDNKNIFSIFGQLKKPYPFYPCSGTLIKNSNIAIDINGIILVHGERIVYEFFSESILVPDNEIELYKEKYVDGTLEQEPKVFKNWFFNEKIAKKNYIDRGWHCKRGTEPFFFCSNNCSLELAENDEDKSYIIENNEIEELFPLNKD